MAMALAATVCSACGGATAFGDGDRSAVETVLTTQRDAWNRGDIEAFMAGYERSPDLVFTAGGDIERGWDEAIARYRERYGGNTEGMGTLDFELLDVRSLGADGAVVLGRWRVTDSPNDGSGVFSVVLARSADGWKIVHDHTSSDPPASE
jgi:beta-aspartyl-peptidase (threonine type)